jgi:hypothetical protein
VNVAIKALEEAGLLSWVHRLSRIRRRECDLFGQLVTVWQIVRVSTFLGSVRADGEARICSPMGARPRGHSEIVAGRARGDRGTYGCRRRNQSGLGRLER